MRILRIVQLMANVIVIGFLFGNLLSIAQFNAWIYAGMGVSLLSVIFCLNVVLALISNKNWYCSFVCPFGSAQELTGMVIRKNFRMPMSARKMLRILRRLVLVSVLALMILKVSVDYTYIEPFAAFQWHGASWIVLILAIVFLLVSMAIPRCWCTYLCPTGQILELFQRPLIGKKRYMQKKA